MLLGDMDLVRSMIYSTQVLVLQVALGTVYGGEDVWIFKAKSICKDPLPMNPLKTFASGVSWNLCYL